MFRPKDTPILCILKATATKPIKGHLVVALGPVPPAPPPPPPFRFSSVYTSNMVLQSAPRRAVVWGFCRSVTDTVSVTFDGSKLEAAVGYRAAGVATWSVTLPATEASFDEHTIVAESSSGDTATISGVLFGSVFVASGQSNMAYGLNGSNGRAIVHPPVNNSREEFAAMRNYPHIRLLRAGYNMASAPALELLPADYGGDVAPVTGWSLPCDSSGVCRVDFSCIAWFFARDVFDALSAAGKPRPIGMIGTYVGGTPDEDWSSPEALNKCLDPRAPMPSSASHLWNGMVVPLINTTIEGAIWCETAPLPFPSLGHKHLCRAHYPRILVAKTSPCSSLQLGGGSAHGASCVVQYRLVGDWKMTSNLLDVRCARIMPGTQPPSPSW
jgi:hypothetical protein